MAPRRAAEIRDTDDRSLIEQLGEAKQELFNLRFQNVTGRLDNYARLRQGRKDIARMNTELRRREIEAAEALEQQRNG